MAVIRFLTCSLTPDSMALFVNLCYFTLSKMKNRLKKTMAVLLLAFVASSPGYVAGGDRKTTAIDINGHVIAAYNIYLSINNAISVNEKLDRLMLLDSTLRHMQSDTNFRLFKTERNENKYIHIDRENIEKFRALGLSIEHYNDALEYDGRFLKAMHDTSPNSKYRKFSLYSQVFLEDEAAYSGSAPNFEAADQYLKEFPDGPYSYDVHLYLLRFYNEIFYHLSALVEYEEPLSSYLSLEGYCFEGENIFTEEPLEVQKERARKKAKYHIGVIMKKYPKRFSSDYLLEEIYENLLKKKPNHVVSYFCPD